MNCIRLFSFIASLLINKLWTTWKRNVDIPFHIFFTRLLATHSIYGSLRHLLNVDRHCFFFFGTKKQFITHGLCPVLRLHIAKGICVELGMDASCQIHSLQSEKPWNDFERVARSLIHWVAAAMPVIRVCFYGQARRDLPKSFLSQKVPNLSRRAVVTTPQQTSWSANRGKIFS